MVILTHLINHIDSPGMHWRIYITEIPLVGRNLPVRVLVAVFQEQAELLFGKGRVYHCQRQSVESRIPNSKPWIFPFIRHGNDIPAFHVRPAGIACIVSGVLVQPAFHIELVILFGPYHAGQCLPQNTLLFLVQSAAGQGGVKIICFLFSLIDKRIEAGKNFVCSGSGGFSAAQAQSEHASFSGRNIQGIVCRRFGTVVGGVDGIFLAADDMIIDTVFGVGARVVCMKESTGVGFVFTEQQSRCIRAIQPVISRFVLLSMDDPAIVLVFFLIQRRFGQTRCPRPGITKPECRQYSQICRFRATVDSTDPDQNVFRISLGIFYKNIEIPVFIENPGIQQLVLRFLPGTPFAGSNQIFVGISSLRIFVEVLQIAVGGSGIQVKIIFFDVFPVVALQIGHAKQAFFQHRIVPVPQCQCETKQLPVIADTCQAIFPPAVSTRT